MILPSGRGETERQSVENFRSFCRDISCLSRRRSDVYHVAFDSSALKITSTAPLLWSQWEFVEIPIHSSHCHPSVRHLHFTRRRGGRRRSTIAASVAA